jgi:hypothetical protein
MLFCQADYIRYVVYIASTAASAHAAVDLLCRRADAAGDAIYTTDELMLFCPADYTLRTIGML